MRETQIPRRRRAWWAWAALPAAGCLGPLTSDEIPSDRVYGVPPAIHLEDDPELRHLRDAFPDHVAYLQGYAAGETVWYWSVPGPSPAFIAPAYFVVTSTGSLLSTVIDVIPGDLGYSPWWRRITVKVTDRYDGERIWSRAAIDEGVRQGILEHPVETELVLDCPVVRRGESDQDRLKIALDPGGRRFGTSHPVWYRNRMVDWVGFRGESIRLPPGTRELPALPVYILRRTHQPLPIYELATGVDLDGDGLLRASNNVFARGITAPDYSPLWYVVAVRTSTGLRSIDSAGAGTYELKSEDAILAATSTQVLEVQRSTGTLVNCPIQRAEGAL